MKKAPHSTDEDRIKRVFEDTGALFRAFAADKSAVMLQAAALMADCVKSGGTVFFAGNGGSASQSQHAAAELVGRFTMERPAFRAISLTTDTSILTSVGNDYGFERIFDRQVEALGKKGDVFVGLSTSGNSENVLRAMKLARKMKIKTIVLTGRGGGKIAGLADILIDVPEDLTWRIQEIHLAVLHILCGEVERALSGKSKK